MPQSFQADDLVFSEQLCDGSKADKAVSIC
jgi:hypothetical protein